MNHNNYYQLFATIILIINIDILILIINDINGERKSFTFSVEDPPLSSSINDLTVHFCHLPLLTIIRADNHCDVQVD